MVHNFQLFHIQQNVDHTEICRFHANYRKIGINVGFSDYTIANNGYTLCMTVVIIINVTFPKVQKSVWPRISENTHFGKHSENWQTSQWFLIGTSETVKAATHLLILTGLGKHWNSSWQSKLDIKENCFSPDVVWTCACCVKFRELNFIKQDFQCRSMYSDDRERFISNKHCGYWTFDKLRR